MYRSAGWICCTRACALAAVGTIRRSCPLPMGAAHSSDPTEAKRVHHRSLMVMHLQMLRMNRLQDVALKSQRPLEDARWVGGCAQKVVCTRNAQ